MIIGKGTRCSGWFGSKCRIARPSCDAPVFPPSLRSRSTDDGAASHSSSEPTDFGDRGRRTSDDTERREAGSPHRRVPIDDDEPRALAPSREKAARKAP